MAISLCFDFDTYLIDDATSFKEINFREKFDIEFNKKIASGARIILSTHEAKSAKKMCNYFIVIKDKLLHGFENYDEALVFYNSEKFVAA